MADLFSGTPQTATSYTTTSSETPKWMQDAIYTQIQNAHAIAATPYKPYDLARVAGMDPLQKRAYDQVGQNVGSWKPGFDVATAGTQNLAGTTSVANVNAYMNPYMTNVTDQIAKLGARNLSENLLPAVSDSFVRAGQFGGSRMGEFGSRAVRDTQEAILGQQAGALQQGYTQALGASTADLQRQQGALGQLADLSRLGQGMQTTDIASLEAAGRGLQGQKQAELDAAYAQWQKEQDYPKTQADWLNAQVRGLYPAVPSTQTSTQQSTGQTYSPSPLSQLAQAAASMAGVYKMFN